MATLKELMVTLLLFVLVAVEDVLLWEAPLGELEVLVAQFPDGAISCTRPLGRHTPLIVTFSRFDDSLGALLREWTLVPA